MPSIIINALFIIAGWFLLFKNAKDITQRNEAYSILQNLDKSLVSIEVLGRDFWAGNHSPTHLEIQNYMHQIGTQIMLARGYLEQLELYYEIAPQIKLFKVRKAATEDCEAQRTTPNHDKPARLVEVVENIRKEVMKCFSTRYR